MGSFRPSRPETEADQEAYTRARLVEVSCLDCLVVVGVKKNSEHHTSIQWSGQSFNDCPEFARMSAAPRGRETHAPCPRLLDSIEHAVRDGQIPIGAEDGY